MCEFVLFKSFFVCVLLNLASEGEHPAVHQLNPGGTDGAHQQRLLRGARLVLQRAGGHEQEPPQ